MSTNQRAVPGEEAALPSEPPRRGWWPVLRQAWKEARADHVPLLSAGVAFYAFLALVPTLIAIVLIYGLVSDPEDVAEQVDSLGSALPSSAEELLTEQMETLAATSQRSLGIGLVVALALALWSASSGIGNLITALNVAYDEQDERGFVKSKLLALGFTLAAIIFVALAIGLVAAAPVVLRALDAPGWVAVLAHAARWLGLVVAVLIALALVLPVGATPRRADVSVAVRRRRRRDRPVDRGLSRVLRFRRQFRLLRQDVRIPRRSRRASPMAVADRLCDSARRRDQRRVGGASLPGGRRQ